MYRFKPISLFIFLGFAASQAPNEDRIYPINATGERTFSAPRYSSRDNPSDWTARVALTRDDYFEGDYYRTATWLDTPFDVPVNGSSIIRDVCLFMQLPIIKRTDDIDYSKGENGCNDVLGEECVEKLKDFLEERYKARTAENGTMDCTTTSDVGGSWTESIYDICPVYRELSGSGYQFSRLIPSDHEAGSALHGDENGYWLAIGTPRNRTEATPEEQYDEVSQYVFTYSIISGPEYDGPDEDHSVEMVCVKAENLVEGSRELPSGANSLGIAREMLILTFGLMIFSGLTL